jgi:hypothetical protein
MTLLKTTDELKNYCSIVSLNLDIESLKSYIRKGERFIKESLGTAFYNAYNTKYNNDTLTTDEKLLLPFIQDPLTNISLYLWINGGQLKVSDVGVQIDHSNDKKTAFQWQIDAWKEDLEQTGFNGLDDLLTYLESKKSVFTDWASDSTAFTQNKQFFVLDAVTFSGILDIGNSRRTFKKLAPFITMTHDMQLKPNLGDDFFNELKAALVGGTLSTEQKALVPYMQKCEVYFSLAQAYGPLRFVNKGNGLRVYETLNSIENADTQKAVGSLDAEANSRQMEELGKYYLMVLLKYLNEHASDYTTWADSDKYVEPGTEPTERNYLGDGIVGIF